MLLHNKVIALSLYTYLLLRLVSIPDYVDAIFATICDSIKEKTLKKKAQRVKNDDPAINEQSVAKTTQD